MTNPNYKTVQRASVTPGSSVVTARSLPTIRYAPWYATVQLPQLREREGPDRQALSAMPGEGSGVRRLLKGAPQGRPLPLNGRLRRRRLDSRTTEYRAVRWEWRAVLVLLGLCALGLVCVALWLAGKI